MLQTAMKKLQALEAYQQLLSSSSSGATDSKLQRKAGDSPADVAEKIAQNSDEVPLLDAAILIAQVSSVMSVDGAGSWAAAGLSGLTRDGAAQRARVPRPSHGWLWMAMAVRTDPG